ncbi:Cerato-platanin [Lasiosphaeria hispida]|uniref:Cerato-platanin n=1 Tax=Lasiosphaeria hispida TaxID=260671 RepID=A0AAJ0HQ76_9PEZI|nr:Cerato-platanin [Lasiosphaeria hispida]
MYPLKTIATVLSFALAAAATLVTYDIGYDDSSRTMEFVACSDGVNGLIGKYGWSKQGEVTRFPYIGGAEAVEDWNSDNCGTCWSATYNDKTIYVLAIDHTENGLNLGLEAMEDLTDGNAVHLGRVQADVYQVPISNCGL